MRVPEGGFGKKLDAMYEWHTGRSIRAINSTGRRDENGRDIIRWCVADPEAFADEFSKIDRGSASPITGQFLLL